MPSLTDAHITTLAAIREITRRGVAAAWEQLAAYDEAQVAEFLATAVPIVTVGQEKASRLTDAYVAAMLGRQPFGIPTSEVTGAAVRAGVLPDEVYRRPFVTVWTALSAGSGYDEAVNAGLARATNLAATDVQLTARQTFQSIQDLDSSIYGYARRADGAACKFCRLVDGAYVKSAGAMPLHPGCGCGLEPLTGPHARAVALPDGTPIRDFQGGPLTASPLPDGVAVHEHGELGPTLGDPEHDFTQL